jgi:hypothetical protein
VCLDNYRLDRNLYKYCNLSRPTAILGGHLANHGLVGKTALIIRGRSQVAVDTFVLDTYSFDAPTVIGSL